MTAKSIANPRLLTSAKPDEKDIAVCRLYLPAIRVYEYKCCGHSSNVFKDILRVVIISWKRWDAQSGDCCTIRGLGACSPGKIWKI